MASKEYTTIASKDFQLGGYHKVLKTSKDSKNFESFDTVVSLESSENSDSAPLVKAVISKDLESNAYKAYKTVVKPSENSKYLDANNTVILLDSKDHKDLVELMCSNEHGTPKKKLYCQICCFVSAFYVILLFFSVIFVLICIRYEEQ